MPKLLGPTLKEVKLPESGVTCKIALTYKDTSDMQKNIFSAMKGLKVKGGDAELDATILADQKQYAILAGLKEWDAEDETGKTLDITWENVGKLSPNDGDFLARSIDGLTQQSEMTDEDKKK